LHRLSKLMVACSADIRHSHGHHENVCHS
jgi:hypothetical protein